MNAGAPVDAPAFVYFRKPAKCGKGKAVAYPDSLSCEVILLAAGRSRRMGGVDKLLLPVAGEAMVRRSARLYLDRGMTLTVVTGRNGRSVAAALAGLDCRIVANPDADRGQQTSVRAGLAAAALTVDGVIVALADQPLLVGEDIAALVAAFSASGGGRICVPRYGGKRGNPVIFPAATVRALREPGGMAPRGFIDAHPEQVLWFDAPNDHFTRDVDTPADAAELLCAPLLSLAQVEINYPAPLPRPRPS